MTVSTLIDYLNQIVADGGGDLPVVLTEDDFTDEGDFISLAFVINDE